MLRNAGCFALACAAMLIGACNNAKSPSTVAKDVDSASQSAMKDTAKAEDKAADKIAGAETNEQHVASAQEENVAKTDAEGDRKVALAKCESLSGDQQRSCKDHANAAYDQAGTRQHRPEAEITLVPEIAVSAARPVFAGFADMQERPLA
jgi:hypothetical protein